MKLLSTSALTRLSENKHFRNSFYFLASLALIALFFDTKDNIGTGDKLDESRAQKLGPGGFVDLPANANHYAFATVETVIQISAEGPFAIKYANPADDPSKSP